MNDLDFVLSDKFFEYTEEMKAIHEELKVHEAELKEFYQQHKENTASLKEKAEEIQAKWDQHKKDAVSDSWNGLLSLEFVL